MYRIGLIDSNMLLLNPLTIGIFMTTILGIFVFVYTKIRNIKAKKMMQRDIGDTYSPSIVAYLLNNIVTYKDLIADIMNLYAKKIIDIKKNENNKIQFYLGDKKQIQKIKSKSDIYIINTLINDKENKKFEFERWKKYVTNEYEQYNFSKTNLKNIINLKNMSILAFFVGIIGAIIGTLRMNSFVGGYLGFLVGLIVGTFAICFLLEFADKQSNSNMFLSDIGKNELQKWMGVKDFMLQYTLISDRSFEEIVLYESYIPYAIPLGVNTKSYKDTKFDIFDIDEIRSIINGNNVTTSLERLGIDFDNIK